MESPCHGCGGSLGRDGCREESENGAEGVLGWTKGELMGRERRVRLLQVEVLWCFVVENVMFATLTEFTYYS